eukprot:COSAG06_NODE_280_length_18452_cov_26.989660_5_plen_539_part_00
MAMEEEEDEEEALYQRGLSHLLGTDGVEASVALALECFARPAERGHAAAQYSLASCYLTADPAAGRAADPAVAVQWLERAAAQSHAAAQHELGLCLASGTGVAQDPAAAAALYSEAAAQGLGTAQCALAECLLHGTGVPVDTDRAQELFRAALAQGIVPDRSMSYGECLRTFPHDAAASVGWLDGQAAQHQRFEALLEIGVAEGDSLLDVGCGVGHLWDYCLRHRAAGALAIRYTGLDCHAAAIEAAKRLHGSSATQPEPEPEPEPTPDDEVGCSPRWMVGRAEDVLGIVEPSAAMPGDDRVGIGSTALAAAAHGEREGDRERTREREGERAAGAGAGCHRYDWVVLSGTFNLGVTEGEMWATLRACLQLCRRGVAFNLLLSTDDDSDDDDDDDHGGGGDSALDQRERGDGGADIAAGDGTKQGADVGGDVTSGGDEGSSSSSSSSSAQNGGAAAGMMYCSYDPADISHGVERLLRLRRTEHCGDDNRSIERPSALGDRTCCDVGVGGGSDGGLPPRVVLTPGEEYGLPYDFTVRVLL